MDFSTLSDEQLMEWVVRKEAAAFAVLVRRYDGRFYRFCYRFFWNREDAEEAVQACFLKLWSKAAQWNPARQTRFTTWFFRITIHHCLDMKKKKKPQLFDEAHAIDATPQEENRTGETVVQRTAVLRAMRSLSEKQMTALNLCFFEGLSNQEAADAMDMKLKALQSLLVRGKEELRRQLSQGHKK